jgi:hypothetical protein
MPLVHWIPVIFFGGPVFLGLFIFLWSETHQRLSRTSIAQSVIRLIHRRYRLLITLLCVAILTGLYLFDSWLTVDSSLTGESRWSDYARGMSTETLGILFTVLLVDRLIDRHEHQEDRMKEVRSLRKANVVLSMYIDRFQLHACEVVTADRLNPNADPLPTRCPDSWEFRDMRRLLTPSMLVVGDRSPKVLCCLKAFRELLSVTVSEGTTFSAMWGPSWNLWVSMKRSTFESPLIFSRESA